MPRGQAGGGLKRPTDAACLEATGCSAAELAGMADSLPAGTLAGLFGVEADAVTAEFRAAAAASLATDEVAGD